MNDEQNSPVSELEKALIKGCIKSDRTAQNRLYELFSRKMFAVAHRYSESKEEAEDTFHEGFMRVFDNIKNFKNEGSLEGWIRKIILNVALRKYQKKLNTIVTVPINDADKNENEFSHYYTDDIGSKLDVNKIMKLIDGLPPAYKVVFNLYEFEGFKHHEIAAQLGITEGTSKSNLSRAKAILKKILENDKPKLEYKAE